MLNLTMESIGANAGRLKIEGEATIEQALSLRQALLAGLDQYDELQVDCAQTTAVDVFTVQLLCSAHRSSVVWNKLLTFHGQPSAAVAEGIRSVGFARHQGCNLCPQGVRCLWL